MVLGYMSEDRVLVIRQILLVIREANPHSGGKQQLRACPAGFWPFFKDYLNCAALTKRKPVVREI